MLVLDSKSAFTHIRLAPVLLAVGVIVLTAANLATSPWSAQRRGNRGAVVEEVVAMARANATSAEKSATL